VEGEVLEPEEAVDAISDGWGVVEAVGVGVEGCHRSVGGRFVVVICSCRRVKKES